MPQRLLILPLVFVLIGVMLIIFHPSNGYSKAICSQLPQPTKTFHDMKLESFEKFEDERFGIGVTYSSNNERLSLFKFDLGIDEISADDEKKALNQGVRDLVQVAKKLRMSIRTAVRLKTLRFRDLVFQNFFMELVKGDIIEYNFLSISHDRKCFFKIRFTDEISLEENRAIKLFHQYSREILTNSFLN